MIDLTEYNLIYSCKATGKIFRARAIEAGVALLIDPETGIKQRHWITSPKFKSLFKGSRENRKAKNKPRHALPSSGSGLLFSRKFQKYLNETEERLVNF